MIVTAVEQHLSRFPPIEGGLLVAVSGGIDSTVLLHILAGLADGHGFKCAAGHVNHGLRGPESEADEVAVRDLARGLGLPIRVARIDPGSERLGHVSRTRPTLQEASRRLRYEALAKLASEVGARRVATAHNLDDQAETVLLRVFRGCGPDGLAGIPERSRDGSLVRPLLDVSRDQIAEYAKSHGLCWREDASNDSPRYTRNRLRNEWLPSLSAAFNPQLKRHLADLAEAHRRDAEWIESMVTEAAQDRLIPRPDEDALELVKTGWNDLPEALARRLVVMALREMGAGRDLSRVHLMRVLGFLRAEAGARNGAVIELPGGMRLTRERRRYLLTRMLQLG